MFLESKMLETQNAFNPWKCLVKTQNSFILNFQRILSIIIRISDNKLLSDPDRIMDLGSGTKGNY